MLCNNRITVCDKKEIFIVHGLPPVRTACQGPCDKKTFAEARARGGALASGARRKNGLVIVVLRTPRDRLP